MTRHTRPLNAVSILVVSVVFFACGPAAPPPAVGPEASPTAPAPPAPPVPTGGTLAEQREGYLAAVYAALRSRWDQVRDKATAMLPPDHPANQLSRATGLSARLDRQGKILSVGVVKSSGHVPFDESAKAALEHIRPMPGLPPLLRKGHMELRWTLHRDARSCAVEHASLVLHPLNPEETFADALQEGDMNVAHGILVKASHRQKLLDLLARAALAARGDELARRRALRVAPRALLVSLLPAAGKATWDAAVAQLALRKDAAALQAELTRVAAEAHGPGKVMRVAALVEALDRAGAHGPDEVVAGLMKDADMGLVMAAAPGARAPAPLDRAMVRLAKKPALAGSLAVYRLALGAAPAAARVLEAAWQDSKHRPVLLDAMARRPSAAMTTRVEALVRSTANPPAVRIKAIQVLARLKGSVSPFYVALLSRRQEVRLAAIDALGQRKDQATSISYRLSVVAKWGGTIGAAALRAVARFGEARFLSDASYLVRVQAKKLRPSVVAEMWHFGPSAVPFLAKQLALKDPKMQQAAAASLARVKGPAAQQALAEYRKTHPAPPSRKKPESKLARLLGRVIALQAAGKK